MPCENEAMVLKVQGSELENSSWPLKQSETFSFRIIMYQIISYLNLKLILCRARPLNVFDKSPWKPKISLIHGGWPSPPGYASCQYPQEAISPYLHTSITLTFTLHASRREDWSQLKLASRDSVLKVSVEHRNNRIFTFLSSSRDISLQSSCTTISSLQKYLL